MHEEDFELTFDLEPLEPAPQPKAAAPAVPVPRRRRPCSSCSTKAQT